MDYLELNKSPILGQRDDVNHINETVISQNLNAFDEINKLKTSDSYSLTYLGDLSKYGKYGVFANPINTEEEINKERAKNQNFLEQTGRSIAQIVENEIALGTVLGISSLWDMIGTIGTDKGLFENNSALTDKILEMQEANKERLEIYRQNPNETFNMSDFGWWADNFVSVGSTVALMAPSMGTTALVGKILSAGKLGRMLTKGEVALAKGINRAIKATGRAAKSEKNIVDAINASIAITSNATLSRTMENWQEGHEVYKSVYDKSLNKLNNLTDEERDELIKNNPIFATMTSNEEIAKYIAGESATTTFKNDYAMLLMDMMQFKGIHGILKGVPDPMIAYETDRLASQTIANFGRKEIIKNVEKLSFPEAVKSRLKYAGKNWWHMLEISELSEGIEEGYQGIQSVKGEEVAERIFNPNYDSRTLDSYLTDGEIWEQAFWGVIGGLAFEGLGAGFKKAERELKAYRYKKENEDTEFHKEKYEQIKLGDEYVQQANIIASQERFNQFREDIDQINNGVNPFDYTIDEETGAQKYSKNGTYKGTTLTESQQKLARTEAINNFIADLVIDAAESGNADFLEALLNSKEFAQALDEIDVEDTNQLDLLKNVLLKKYNEVKNIYYDALIGVNDNILEAKTKGEVGGNEYAIKATARAITRSVLRNTLLEQQKQNIDDLIAEETKNNTNLYLQEELNRYYQVRKAKQADAQIKEIQRVKEEIKQQYANGKLTSYGYKTKLEELNKQLRKLKDYISSISDIVTDDNTVLLSRFDKDRFKLFGDESDYNNFVDAFNEWYDNNIKHFSYGEGIHLSDKVKEHLNDKVYLEVQQIYNNLSNPETQDEYIDLYRVLGDNIDSYVIKKRREYLDFLANLLNNADNIDEMYERIRTIDDHINNRTDRKIQTALKIANLISPDYLQRLVDEAKGIQGKREEENKKVTVNGHNATPTTANTVKQSINKQEDDDKKADEKEPITIHSTGKQQEAAEDEDEASKIYGQFRAEEESQPDDSQTIVLATYESDVDNTIRRLSIEAKNIINRIVKGDLNLLNELTDNQSPSYIKLYERVLDEIKSIATQYTTDENIIRQSVEDAIKTIKAIYTSTTFKNAIAKALQDKLKNKYSTTGNVDTIREEFYKTIADFFSVYIDKLNIQKIQGKQPIDVESLFTYLLENKTPIELIYELYDSLIGFKSDDYVLTNTKLFNRFGENNATDFINELIIKNRHKNEFVNFVRVEGTRLSRKGQAELVNKGLNDARLGKCKLVFEKVISQKGNVYAISLRAKYDDGSIIEVGMFTKVTPTLTDNNGFELIKIPDFTDWETGNHYLNNFGFRYKVERINGQLVCNLDDFVNKLLTDASKETRDFVALLFSAKRDKAGHLRDNTEIKKINDYVKDLVDAGILGFGNNITTNTEKDAKIRAEIILEQVHSLVRLGSDDVRGDYEEWKQMLFNTYRQCYEIQNNLEKSGIEVKANIQDYDSALVDYSSEAKTQIGELNLVKEQDKKDPLNNPVETNPIVIIRNNKIVAEGSNGDTYDNVHRTYEGKMGIRLVNNPEFPIIAWFTGSQFLGKTNAGDDAKLKEAFKKELLYLLVQHNDPKAANKISFDELKKRLTDLLGGTKTKDSKSNLFKGCDVHILNDKIALSFSGKTDTLENGKEVPHYDIIIYKNTGPTSNTPGNTVYYYPTVSGKATKYFGGNNRQMEQLVDMIADKMQYNATYITFKDATELNNTYIKNENGKLHIKIGTYDKVYNSFTEFALQNNAFITNIVADENGNFLQFATDEESRRSSALRVSSYTISLPVEGRDTKTIAESVAKEIERHDADEDISPVSLLQQEGHSENKIKVITGNNSYGINLVGIPIRYDENNNGPAIMEYDKSSNKIIITRTGYEQIRNGNTKIIRHIIHENIHAMLNEHDIMNRTHIVNDLLNLYKSFYETVQSDTTNKNAQKIRDWLRINSFTLKDYIEKNNLTNLSKSEQRKRFAEEFLVESLTQPIITTYLSDVEYSGKELHISGRDVEHESIWDKIVKLLLKIFGIENLHNSKKNSIFAQEMLLLKDVKEKEKPKSRTRSERVKRNKIVTAEIKEGAKTIDGTQQLIDFDIQEQQLESTSTAQEQVAAAVQGLKEENGVTILTADDFDLGEKLDTSGETDIDLDDDFRIFSTTTDIISDNENKDINDVNREAIQADTNFGNRDTIVISDMESFVRTYPQQDQLNIAENIKNGEFTYVC